MINNVSFTGRETMLTAGLEKAAKKAANKAEEFIGTGHVFEGAENAPVQKSVNSLYSSPFALILPEAQTVNNTVGKIINYFG